MKTTRKFYVEWKSPSGWWRISGRNAGEFTSLKSARLAAKWRLGGKPKAKRRIVEQITKIHKV